MNPDGYNFLAICNECGEKRSVSTSRNQVILGDPVTVYAIACDHAWTLSPEETQKLSKHLTAAA